MIDPSLKELVELFTRLPGIGERTATRLVMHLLSSRPEYTEALGRAIGSLHGQMRRCDRCRAWTSAEVCPICSNPARDEGALCIVAHEPDLWAIEKAAAFRGKYYVLHGLLSPLDGMGPEELEIERLERRIAEAKPKEIIVALRSSVEGEATALYLAKRFGGRVKITRLASGLPHGGEIEYADQVTLARALEWRREL